MRIPASVGLALFGLALACGGDSAGDSGGTTSGTGDEDLSTGGPATNPTTPTDPDATGPADTTAGPVGECDRTVRYPLFDGQACGRVLVGDVDGDGVDDVIAFGNDGGVIGPLPTTMQTFLGGRLGLDRGEVHCCLDASPTGAGAVFDINGDGDGDPLWASERVVFSGDVGETQLTMEKSIRAPEHGYTGAGVLFADPQSPPPPFTVGRITPQIMGVIVVADGMLISMVGNGDGLSLEPTNTLVLDPVPLIRALATIEIDAQPGVDVVGVGPDGLLVWGGSVEGVFADATVIELPGEYTDIESLDVDLDGMRELVLFGAGEPVALVDGTGPAVQVSTAGPAVTPPATVIEVDNDLYPDLVAIDGGSLVMHPGDGDMFADAVVLAPIGNATDLAYGDFDGNGSADVVACDEQGLLVVYRADR